MSLETLDLNRTYFDLKAARYHAAFKSAPAARTMELLPFLFFLGSQTQKKSENMVLADLLCGDGHFVGALDGSFRMIQGVDLSPALLSYFPSSATAKARVAAIDESSDLLARDLEPDAIISTAALHHIYHLENGLVDPVRSDERQLAVLLNWANSLPQDGVMVVADLPEPEEAVAFSTDDRRLRLQDGLLAAKADTRVQFLANELGQASLPWSGRPATIKEYVQQVVSFSHCAPQKAQPGRWFNEVVARKSLYGHVAHFPRPSVLVPGLQDKGFQVEYHDLPTPLLFASTKAFVRFFYDAFALGPKLEGNSEVPASTEQSICRLVEEHLGIYRHPSGSVCVGWRSGYYCVTRLK